MGDKKDFNWDAYQKFLGYSDEEMRVFRSDPHREELSPKIFSREMAGKRMVIEVVKSHGCSVGMKPGDKLIFRSMGVLDLKRSSPWCAQAMGSIPGIANMLQDRFVSGLDPNKATYNHFSCEDVGPECGWGQVIMKAYVEDDVD